MRNLQATCSGSGTRDGALIQTFEQILEEVRSHDALMRAAFEREMKLQRALLTVDHQRQWWQRATTAIVRQQGRPVFINNDEFMALEFRTSVEVIECTHAICIRTHELNVGQG